AGGGRQGRRGFGGRGGRCARVRGLDRRERVLDQLEVVTRLDLRQALLLREAGGGVDLEDLEGLALPLENLLRVGRRMLLRGEALLVLPGGAGLGGCHRRSGERDKGAGRDDERASVHVNSSAWIASCDRDARKSRNGRVRYLTRAEADEAGVFAPS